MAVFKCKMCGGDLDVTEGSAVAQCYYCDTKQTVPMVDSEKKTNLFNRANRLRMSGEFDKAANIYESILTEFPSEAEAYWGLCLCDYGIEYVDDPATGNKIPTCHRASFERLQDDANFKSAVRNADYAAKAVYESEAVRIDEIMADILSISRNESPYDIFICYKETDSNGQRTIDSVMAQDLYDALTQKGYRVFFARITLEDKLGRQYEPYIFAALNSAKVMLVVGTSYDHLHAVWVQNEWSRFLKLMARDKSKVLIPCYKDMDAYDLPEKFKMLQAQDLSKIGATQDLIRGIEKLIVRDTKLSASNAITAVDASVASLLKRMEMSLEDDEWDDAEKCCERILDIDPECVQAYFGKLMATYRCHDREGLKFVGTNLENDLNVKRIRRFGSQEDIAFLNECKMSANAALLKRMEMSLENGEWEEAETYCKRILDIDPECVQAYFGKLMATQCCTNRDALLTIEGDIEDDPNVKRIRRFGSQEDIAFIDECVELAKTRGMDVSCPYCERVFHVTDAILEKGYGNCPFCGEKLSFDFDNEEDAVFCPVCGDKVVLPDDLDGVNSVYCSNCKTMLRLDDDNDNDGEDDYLINCATCRRDFMINPMIASQGLTICPYCSTRLQFEPYGPMNTVNKQAVNERALIGEALD